MTLIAKPVINDSPVLNHIARDLLVDANDPANTKLKRYFKVLTEDGVVHDISFGQLDGLINILDLSRETPKITPLQYLIQAYDISDLTEMGTNNWLVSEYTITVLHSAKTVRFEGILKKAEHVDKEFSFALAEFDFIQQFSLSRVIASQNEQLKSIAGTFDYSYTFSFGPNGIRVKPLTLEIDV